MNYKIDQITDAHELFSEFLDALEADNMDPSLMIPVMMTRIIELAIDNYGGKATERMLSANLLSADKDGLTFH